MVSKRWKVAVVALHPIPYQIPIWSELGRDPDVDLTVLYCEHIYEKQWEVPLGEGYAFDYFRNWGRSPHKGFFRRINPGLAWHLLTHRYDAVLVHGYDTVTAWLSIIAAKLSGKTLLFRGEATLAGSSKRLLWLRTLVLRFLFSLCSRVLYSCTANKEYYLHYGVREAKLSLIPCAVDNAYFQAEHLKWFPLRDQIRAELGIPPDGFMVVLVARLEERKRQLDLLKAAVLLEAQGIRNIYLVFAGEGASRLQLERFIADNPAINAHLLGFQHYETVTKYFSAATLGAIISDNDPSPKALNEMLNFELPVVVSDAVGTSMDLVAEGRNGFVVPVGDVDAIALAIRTLSEDPALARQMGRHSLDIVSNWTFARDALAIKQAIISVHSERDATS